MAEAVAQGARLAAAAAAVHLPVLMAGAVVMAVLVVAVVAAPRRGPKWGEQEATAPILVGAGAADRT
jgi:hypothetical protein